MRGVCFSYDGESEPVVRDCSARFEAGRKYAITGRSGCGKSTVLGLLSGALTPQEGSIRVDGKGRSLPDVASIHQNVFLFDDTLMKNITLGGSFTQNDVARALQLAGLSDVVAALPQGLDTSMGENGARLSGGERQRVAIARAFANDPDIILADEPTASLDAARGRQVVQLLAEQVHARGKAAVMVTHDERVLDLVDAVYELEGGSLSRRA